MFVLDAKSIEKGDKRVVCQSELRSCVKREVGWALIPVPFFPPSLASGYSFCGGKAP